MILFVVDFLFYFIITLFFIPSVSQPASPNTSSASQIYARPPIPLRCSSLERPSVPPTPKPGHKPAEYAPSTSHSDYMHPTYVNMYDLANMAASKAAEMKGSTAPHTSTEHKVI